MTIVQGAAAAEGEGGPTFFGGGNDRNCYGDVGEPSELTKPGYHIFPNGGCRQCPPGSCCDGGVLKNCSRSTYNAEYGVSCASGCIDCPLHTTSPPGSGSLEQCYCDQDYYQVVPEMVRLVGQCARCPAGTDCSEPGTTMTSLRLKAGYWRWRLDLPEVRRCPGAVASTAAQNASGQTPCVGGVGFDVCRAGMEGPYCTLCKVVHGDRPVPEPPATPPVPPSSSVSPHVCRHASLTTARALAFWQHSPNESFYYDDDSSGCLSCAESYQDLVTMVASAPGVLLIFFLLLVCITSTPWSRLAKVMRA